MDIGEKTNVHPKNKQDLSDRLARIARAKEYGEKIEYYGPMYESMQVEGQSIRVKFTHAGGGWSPRAETSNGSKLPARTRTSWKQWRRSTAIRLW